MTKDLTSTTTPREQTAKLRAFCTEWKKEIERLEGELAQVHARKRESVIDATALAIAIGIRREAVKAIEAIIRKGASEEPASP